MRTLSCGVQRKVGNEGAVVRHSVRHLVIYLGDIIEEAYEFLIRDELGDRIGLRLDSLAQQHLYPALLGEKLGSNINKKPA